MRSARPGDEVRVAGEPKPKVILNEELRNFLVSGFIKIAFEFQFETGSQ